MNQFLLFKSPCVGFTYLLAGQKTYLTVGNHQFGRFKFGVIINQLRNQLVKYII